jgi:hypothetical protein
MDWSSGGVDWHDSSLDDVMARDWLRATHDPDLYDTDVYRRVLELVKTDLDPPRGWKLVQSLVELAQTDDELWHVGADALSPIVERQADLVANELEHLTRTNPKYRRALTGQISSALYNFERQAGILDDEQRVTSREA